MRHPGRPDGASVLSLCTPDPATWDAFVATQPGDVLPQTAAWAATKQPGQSHEIIGIESEGRLVGGCMVLRRRLGPAELAYAPRGPLLTPGHEHGLRPVLQEVVRRLRRTRPVVLVVQPAQTIASGAATFDAMGFGPAPIDIAPAATVEIDLGPEPDELLAAMRSSTRRNVRKAEKAGVRVRRGARSDLECFHDLHVQTAGRQGFAPLPLDYLERQWDALAPEGMQVHIAELDGVPLSAMTASAFGDRMVFKLAGLSENPEARRVRASDYLHWRVVNAARESGFAWYDFGGFDRSAAEIIEAGGEPPEELRKSASQFKLGFGGAVVTRERALWRLSPRPLRWTQGVAGRALATVPLFQAAVNKLRAD